MTCTSRVLTIKRVSVSQQRENIPGGRSRRRRRGRGGGGGGGAAAAVIIVAVAVCYLCLVFSYRIKYV